MKEEIIFFIKIYLVIVNVIAFVVYGLDKKKAEMHEWRISEKTLFLTAVIGGGAGACLGMRVFHHKTKHWYFVVFIPAITTIWIVLLICLPGWI